MFRLLKIELNKIIYYRTFWIILGLHMILFTPTVFGLDGILKSLTMQTTVGNTTSTTNFSGFSVFTFPSVWHNLAYIASWFKLILAVLVVVLVTNEYNFRTIRQNIIDGMSKWEIIWSKQLIILLISLTASLFLVAITFLVGENTRDVSIFDGFEYLVAYFISLIVYLNFAYFLSAWLKKAGIVIVIMLLYTIIIENIISWILPEYLEPYLLMNAIDSMIPSPFGQVVGKNITANLSVLNLSICLVYTFSFIVIMYRMLKKGKL